MAKDLNKVILTGRLGKNPELKSLPSDGTFVATFSVACGRPVREGDGWREETEWFNIVCWRELAERVANRLQKGSKVLVEGRLQTRKYTDKNGVERYMTEVVANDVISLESRRDQEAAPANSDDAWDSTPTPSRNNNANAGGNRRRSADYEEMEPEDIPF
jgi:single-strand DNA-binding protein